jgi:hypothetical protein
MLLLLSTACIFDSDNPLFADVDGDGVSVYQGDCVDNKPALQGPVVLNDTDYSSLPEAIAAAIPGDTIILCPGEYDPVTITSMTLEGRPEGGEVIVHGRSEGAAITVKGDATLIGLTLTGGIGTKYQGVRYGGGVDATGASSLFMSDCVVEGNSADNGAGIAGPQEVGSSTTLDDVRIRQNHAQQFGGGGLFFDNVTMTDVVVRDNLADSQGGGVVLVESAALISGGAIEGNTANNVGGGLLVASSAVTVDGTDFSLNSPEDLVLQSPNGTNTTVDVPGSSFTCDSTTSSPSCQ